MITIGARRTELLLPFGELIREIEVVLRNVEAGQISWLERTHLTSQYGATFFSMLACDQTIAIHKLAAAQPRNSERCLPTVSGLVAVCTAATGQPLMILDGPVLTARRTAAVSALALSKLRPGAKSALLVGGGALARSHIEALALLGITSLLLRVRNPANAGRLKQFARSHGLECELVDVETASAVDADVVITVTSSSQPVIDRISSETRLVIAVGAYKEDMAELTKRVVRGAHAIYVDTLIGARREAGELIQAGVSWNDVTELAQLCHSSCILEPSTYNIFKSVGHSLWDLAAARVAYRRFAEASAMEKEFSCSA